MSDLLNEKTPIRARYVRPGQAQAVEVKSGELLQIETVQGKQVADFVAFSLGDSDEFVSTAVTRSANTNIVPQKGMTLYSNRRQPMFEIVEDTVGRHDMLFAACDPVRYETLEAPGHANCRESLVEALGDRGIGYDRIPDPVNWFMNVSIQQRGELEVREPLAEAGDYIVLRALKDVVAAISACPQDIGPTNAGTPSDLRIRVYRDASLPSLVMPENGAVAEPEIAEAVIAEAEVVPATSSTSRSAVRPARLADSAEATVIRVEPEPAG